MRKIFIICVLIFATPAYAEKCGVAEYLNGDVCTTIDTGYYGVPCHADLPAEYTELEYLESTNTQYIDTGVLIDSTRINATIDFQMTKIKHNTWFAGAVKDAHMAVQGGIWNSQLYTAKGFSYSSGEVGARQIATMTVFNIPYFNLYLFARSGNLNPKNSYAKIFHVQIYDDKTMIRHMVPARRNSDGVLGMYDLINWKFYTNDGTGEFLSGNPVDCTAQKQCEIGAYCINGGRHDCTNLPDNATYTTAGWINENCPWMCDDGYVQTAVDTCKILCTAGVKKLRTSTGVNVPLFAERNTTPAINIKINNQICYADLVSGESTNAINIQYNDQTYHTVAQ